MNTNAILAIAVGAVLAAASFAFLGSNVLLGVPAAQAQAENGVFTQIAGQVDLKGSYNNLGDGGFFKLIIDTTPTPVAYGHVAISNIRCDRDGLSVFVLVVGTAATGTGTSVLNFIPLDSSNLVGDVSDPGDKCTYHVDLRGGGPVITDIALANSDVDDSKSITDVGSATYNLFVSHVPD